MEEICTIIPLHVLMDMPKEVIFELFGKEKVRPTISVGQRFFCGGRGFLRIYRHTGAARIESPFLGNKMRHNNNPYEVKGNVFAE